MWNKCTTYDFFKFEFILIQIFLDFFFGVRNFSTPIHSTFCRHFSTFLLEEIYIRYHFIFQVLQVFFNENTCNVLYLIFYLLRIFLNILCENFLCFISYLLRTFFNPFLGEYSSPIRFFVTANAQTFLCEKYAPRFLFQ